jgi:hypothetical protein
MRNEGLIKTFTAGAAVAARRIVTFDGTDDGEVIQGAAATGLLIGVSDLSAASGERVDVVLSGVAVVEYGGSVTQGALLTSDADGKAVAAVATNRIIGAAMVGGVSGDLGSVLISMGSA